MRAIGHRQGPVLGQPGGRVVKARPQARRPRRKAPARVTILRWLSSPGQRQLIIERHGMMREDGGRLVKFVVL